MRETSRNRNKVWIPRKLKYRILFALIRVFSRLKKSDPMGTAKRAKSRETEVTRDPSETQIPDSFRVDSRFFAVEKSDPMRTAKRAKSREAEIKCGSLGNTNTGFISR
jgi:hypothetical protein